MGHDAQRVIIAEDEEFIRGFVARIVRRALPAATISEARDGQEALDMFLRDGADLLITNHHMPRLSGIALIEQVRVQDATVPILMLSADPSVQAVARAAGVTLFLAKPITIDLLTQALQTLLGAP